MKYKSKVSIFCALLALALCLYSCEQNQKTPANKRILEGVWIGGALKRDLNFYKPYTLILEFKGDTLYYKDVNNVIKYKQFIGFSMDSITLDSLVIPIHKFHVNKDQLHFINIEAHRLITTVKKIDIDAFDTFLSSTDWKLENEPQVYRFDHKQKKLQYIEETRNTYSQYCYELVTYEDEVFLLKKGNQLACDRDYQFLEQVLSYNEQEIRTYGFKEGQFQDIYYKPVSRIEKDVKPDVFQLCNRYINKNLRLDRYYYKGTAYKGGLYHIRKIFKKNYVVPNNNIESGIFQVRFVVNCEGKAGMYETQAFDNDYKLKEFSPEIADQITEITKTLQDWIPGRISRTNQVIDTYIYLSFRIKDGKIILIYP